MAASFRQFDDLGSKVAAVGSRRSKIIDEERPRLVLELGNYSGSCCHVTSSNSLPSGSASVVWRTAATPVHDSVHLAPQPGTWTRSLGPNDMERNLRSGQMTLVSRLPDSNRWITHYEKPGTPLRARYLHRSPHTCLGLLAAHSTHHIPGHGPASSQ